MTDVSPWDVSLYLEILYIFLAAITAVGLYLLLRRFLQIWPFKGGRARAFLSRLNLPLALVLISLLFQIGSVRRLLFPSGRFQAYLNAAQIFVFLFLLIRIVDALHREWFGRKKKPYPLPRVLHGGILAVLYLLCFFLVLRSVLDINITPFLATSAVLTMILGLAFQGVLSNILAGMSLHLTKSFSRGDWIKVGGDEGVVIDTNWRETRILDRSSNILILPNNLMAGEKITNFSIPDRKTALYFPLKVGYEIPPTDVFKELTAAVADCPEILKTPSPEVHIKEYDDLGISYQLKFWTTDFFRKNVILAEVGRKAWFKFKRRGIEIPVPLAQKIGEVIRTVSGGEAPSDEEALGQRNFEDLMKSSFLRRDGEGEDGELILSREEVAHLASHIRRYRFTQGEVLFQQGESGDTCYVVARGSIQGSVIYAEKGKSYTSEFSVGPGGIFGEMSLFTGMPRTATGVIAEDTELLEIGTGDFCRVLKKNPGLAEHVADLVSRRNTENQAFLRKIKELSDDIIRDSLSRKSILDRLKSWIHL